MSPLIPFGIPRAFGPKASKHMRLLAGIGFGAGDRAVITHGNSASFFADLLAVWSRGGRPFRSTRRWAKSSSRTS